MALIHHPFVRYSEIAYIVLADFELNYESTNLVTKFGRMASPRAGFSCAFALMHCALPCLMLKRIRVGQCPMNDLKSQMYPGEW